MLRGAPIDTEVASECHRSRDLTTVLTNTIMLIFRRFSTRARHSVSFCAALFLLHLAPRDTARAQVAVQQVAVQAPIQAAVGAAARDTTPGIGDASANSPSAIFGDEETTMIETPPATRMPLPIETPLETEPRAPDAPSMASLAPLRARLEANEKLASAGGGVADARNIALWRFKLEQARLWMDDLDRGLLFNAAAAQRQLARVLDRADSIARARGDAVFPTASAIHERAYLTQNDGSSQPYWVFLPRGYSASRKYPLVVFLHGYDPSITKAQPYLPGEKTWSLATARGFIFAVPYGRRNSDFLGIGEDDTLAVTREVQAHYSVDTSRTYLAGASMGGYGTLAIGLHRPDLWAGLAPMAARSDIYLWLKLDREQVALETPWKPALHEADDPRSLKQNAAHLPIFLQHGALDSIVDVTHSRLFASDLHALNYAVRYREITNGDHYIYWQASSYETALDWLSSLRPPGTTRPPPRRVLYTAYDLRDNGAYWARIEAFQTYGKAARIDVQVKPGNLLEATIENVARFKLSPPASFFTPGVALTLRVNGQAVDATFDADHVVRWNAPASNAPGAPIDSRRAASTASDDSTSAIQGETSVARQSPNDEDSVVPGARPIGTAPGQAAPRMSTQAALPALKTTPNVTSPVAVSPVAVSPTATRAQSPRGASRATSAGIANAQQFPGIKTPERSGPLRNCYRDPFLLVYGTRAITTREGRLGASSTNNARTMRVVGSDEANARRFAHEWNLFADGIPPLKSDREVTLDDRRRFNLILFGTRESNSVLAEFADKLPVELTPGGYRLNTQQYKGRNLGLVMCYPSPFDARRMIVVQSGQFWGSALAINHKFDLQPDYIVFNPEFDISDGTNQALAAGYFDNAWQLPESRESASQARAAPDEQANRQDNGLNDTVHNGDELESMPAAAPRATTPMAPNRQ